MTLAQELNDLAVANSKGLLNDDEYRILRQNLFERHASSAAVPVEASVVPAMGRVRGSSAQRRTVSDSNTEPSSTRPPTSRSKSSMTSGMASILRRAASRRAPALSKSSAADEMPNETLMTSKNASKHSVLPRILHRKPSDLNPVCMDTSRSAKDYFITPPRRRMGSVSLPHTPTSSIGPLRYTPPSPSTLSFNISSVENDVFDDEDLHTAKDIRKAIILAEDEAKRLIDAFDNLESSTHLRKRQQNAHRSPISTPTNANILIEGREWRDHRATASILVPEKKSRQRLTDTEDEASIRSGSGSSITTSWSLSKSISSSTPPSPLSARRLTTSPKVRRKHSISSLSSFVSMGRLGVGSPSSLSRSTGHLPLGILAESEFARSASIMGQESGEDAEDVDPDVADVRRRRAEVTARYAARVEYLKAKLKGAELHEKLLRK